MSTPRPDGHTPVELAIVCAVELITDPVELDDLETQWDQLAIACQAPMMSPAFVMAWWRHLAPVTACARVVVVREDDRLIGIAPFYIDMAKPHRRDLRLPGIEIGARLAPLALPGREADVAQGIMQALMRTQPRPDLIALEGMPLTANWAADMRAQASGRMRPITWQYQVHGCPVTTLDAGSFDGWLATKSSHFRSHMRRQRRQFAAAEGTTRVSDPTTLNADITTFMRLHTARWEHRGGSSLTALGTRLPAMLKDMGTTLLHEHDSRFRLYMLEVAGEPMGAHLCLAAGGYVIGMATGWDERFAQLRPGNIGALATIEHALTQGDRCFDMGVVELAYKARFADTSAPVAWTVLIPGGRRFPQTYLSVASMVGRQSIRNAIKQRVSSKQKDHYRRLRQRLRKRRPAR